MGRQIAASGIVFPIHRNRHFSVYFLYFLEPLGASGLYLHGLPAITALLRIEVTVASITAATVTATAATVATALGCGAIRGLGMKPASASIEIA